MALPYNSPDFLRPIRDANRDEVMLVEFHRVLKNTNMALIYNLICAAANDDEIVTCFPGLQAFLGKTLDEIYDLSVLYNYQDELVYELGGGALNKEVCTSYVETFATPYHFEMLHTTRMEGILRNLLKTQFTKGLFIFAPEFNDEMKAYIARMFYDQKIGERVICLEGSMAECLRAHPEITTVFHSNVSELVTLADFDEELIKDRFFVISEGYYNLEPTKDGKDTQYIGESQLSRLVKQKICEIAFAYPYCIPKDPEVLISRKEANPDEKPDT